MSTPDRDDLAPGIDDGPPYVGALLRLCLEQVRGRIEADMRAAGFGDLQPTHFAVLSYPPPDGLRPSELARRIRMSRQATNHVIAQLETLGYLERRAEQEGDRRRIYLTARSWDTVKVIHGTLLRIQAEWAAEIGPERFRDFMATLRHFAAKGS